LKIEAPENFLRDPRLDELETMGLRRSLIEVAEKIGVDNFLLMWRTLDADQRYSHHNPSVLRIHVPRYQSYLRYHRNRYIESLFRAGFDAWEITDRVRRFLREEISVRNVLRHRPKA
jgi:hypothetical protein